MVFEFPIIKAVSFVIIITPHPPHCVIQTQCPIPLWCSDVFIIINNCSHTELTQMRNSRCLVGANPSLAHVETVLQTLHISVFCSFITNKRDNQLILILDCKREWKKHFKGSWMQAIQKQISVIVQSLCQSQSVSYKGIYRGRQNKSLIWHSVFRSHCGAHTPSQTHLPVSWAVGGTALGLRCCGLERDEAMAVPSLKHFFHVQTCLMRTLQNAILGLVAGRGALMTNHCVPSLWDQKSEHLLVPWRQTPFTSSFVSFWLTSNC